MNNKKGSISVTAIMILSIIMIVSNSIQDRFISNSKSLRMYTESENLTRRAEGTAIIAKDKVLEATRILYDSCGDREELKAKIESSYKTEYIKYIENMDDINISGTVIDVLDDRIEQNGTDLYRFRIKCTAYKDGLEKYVVINVSLKNIMKSKSIKDESMSTEENGDNVSESVNDIYDINEAIDFRIIRYN